MSEEKTMRVELMFPSKYIKALELKGKPYTVTISGIKADKLRKVDGTQELKYIVSFEEAEKMLVLNKTNAYKIAEILDELDALKWIGKKIVLYPTTCEAWGETKDCIRVRGVE